MNSEYKVFNQSYVEGYQRSGGKVGGEMRGFKVLLLTTTGRKSGKTRTTPLGCFEHPQGYVIVASYGGSDSNPAWYYNLKENPQVTVQVMDKIFPATAEILTGEARTEAWKKVIAEVPLYGDYEKKTTRQIPLILLRPDK